MLIKSRVKRVPFWREILFAFSSPEPLGLRPRDRKKKRALRFVFTGFQSMRVVHSYHSDCYATVSVKWGFAHQLHMRNKEWIQCVESRRQSPKNGDFSQIAHALKLGVSVQC